jgi:hypothetical protein
MISVSVLSSIISFPKNLVLPVLVMSTTFHFGKSTRVDKSNLRFLLMIKKSPIHGAMRILISH